MKRLLISSWTLGLGLTLGVEAAVYTGGHADLGVGFDGDGLEWHFHSESGVIDGVEQEVELDPDEVQIEVSELAMVTVPMDFPALGVTAGTTIWRLPEGEDPNLPFLGIGTEELDAADWTGPLQISLIGVTSPSGSGHFALWQTGTFGELLLRMSTADPGADVMDLPAETHAHFNYGFTEPGLWQVELQVTGEHATLGSMSDTRTFQFLVVPEPSSVLLGLIGAAGMLKRRRR